MRNNQRYGYSEKRWMPIIGVLLVLVSLITLLVVEEKYWEMEDETAGASGTVNIAFPEINGDILLCSKVAKMLYDNQIDMQTAVQTDDPYRPLVLEYESGNEAGILYLSEKPDMSDAKEYELPAFYQVQRIDNLKTGTEYFYKIVIRGQERSGSFKTQESTRFVTIPGIENTRDIGGYRNKDGQMVRQGLLIRGTEIDGLEYNAYKIPESAIQSVQETFGFVYDLDLRWPYVVEGTYQTPLGSDVKHEFYTSPQYEQIFEQDWKPAIRKIFADLANADHYPMYMHCTWGKDRTGTIVFLLQGVLNMSEEDMMREYLLSAFIHEKMIKDNEMQVVVTGMEAYAGETLQEKIVTYLTQDVGVTMEEITAIRNIFLETAS